MTKTFGIAALLFALGCGDNTTNAGPPDLSAPIIGVGDMAGSNPDLVAVGCSQPSDTCVQNPTTNAEILNSCPPAGTNKVDITPFYPTSGYTNCALPTAP